MAFTDPKISLDKSWKFTPQVLILIILGIFVILGVLIFGGIIYLAIIQEEEFPSVEVVTPPKEEFVEGIFSLSATVLSVDVENNFLMVKPVDGEEEVKVIITKDTKLYRLEYPSESKNPAFFLKRVEITIGDFKKGDHIFIKTNINIAGKKEFNDVDYIEILP